MVGTPILIAFGANIDPVENLHRGLTLLHRMIGIAAISTVWRTPPLPDPEFPGRDGEGADYRNGVALLGPGGRSFRPLELRTILRDIEDRCGRRRGPRRHAPRTLDLDIVMMGSLVFAEDGLVLPDPELTSRPFLVLPCAQLAPEARHPLLSATMATLAERCSNETAWMTPDHEATRRLALIMKRMDGVP
ncbi:MAG: 2-amino-4-hydroxy-6-hydroxymethyldihydropteridine diphosphokinase [Magnetococcales bacterium]|nr:2-amino-4-hydroxy-6-hydroxymethyldihydropteridine diphosphokinase [Magnetococcales bacterium]